MHEFTPWMARGGYLPNVTSPYSVSYSMRTFHTWQIVVAILFFPLGLIGLVAEKKEYRMDALFTEEPNATSILLSGEIPGKASGQLADKIDAFDPAV